MLLTDDSDLSLDSSPGLKALLVAIAVPYSSGRKVETTLAFRPMMR